MKESGDMIVDSWICIWSTSKSCELETVWESTETNLSPNIHSDTETALLGQSLSSEILNVERVSCYQDQDTPQLLVTFVTRMMDQE